MMSYYDTVEKFYHVFVLGLLAFVKDYKITSNRESGYGRYDIMIIPKDKSKKGIILEFKCVRKGEKIDDNIKSALKQIEDKKYEAELNSQGIKEVIKYAVVFEGKKCKIAMG
jgi:hypothetical protein